MASSPAPFSSTSIPVDRRPRDRQDPESRGCCLHPYSPDLCLARPPSRLLALHDRGVDDVVRSRTRSGGPELPLSVPVPNRDARRSRPGVQSELFERLSCGKEDRTDAADVRCRFCTLIGTGRGRPVFTERDWLFLFGHPREKVLSLHLWLIPRCYRSP